eukprot:Colp12_sorted_trinity150504_noHs@20299
MMKTEGNEWVCEPIQGPPAYAKLQGPDFTEYLQTLNLSFPNDLMRNNVLREKFDAQCSAKISYNAVTRSFEIKATGTKPIKVNEVAYNKDSQPIALRTKDKIQVGSVWFWFLLPLDPQGIQQEKEKLQSVEEKRGRSGSMDMMDTRPYAQEMATAERFGATTTESGSLTPPRTAAPLNMQRPQHSYVAMIAQAIRASPKGKCTVQDIYAFLCKKWPFFSVAEVDWKNSIRHNLSLNKCFVRVARTPDDPGKGAYWAINFEAEHKFSMHRRRIEPGTSNLDSRSGKELSTKPSPLPQVQAPRQPLALMSLPAKSDPAPQSRKRKQAFPTPDASPTSKADPAARALHGMSRVGEVQMEGEDG